MFLFLIACSDSKDDDSTIEDQVEELFGDIAFVIQWTEVGIQPEVRDVDIGSWWFGMAEQTAAIYEPWKGEDCLNGGIWQSERYVYCHPILDVGTELSYVDSPIDMIPGEETLISKTQNPDRMMYYFLDALTGICFIDGTGLDSYLELCSNQVEMTILY